MEAANTVPAIDRKTMPGDLAMWMIIFAELTVFAILFFAFTVKQIISPEVFSDGQKLLDVEVGLYITLSLIFASFFVALSVERYKKLMLKSSRFYLYLSVLSGAVYVVLKIFEYQYLIESGYGLTGHDFFTLYFLISGFHLLHVILGLLILIFFSCKIETISLNGFESGASYWHMVDLVWLLLFPLLYLVK